MENKLALENINYQPEFTIDIKIINSKKVLNVIQSDTFSKENKITIHKYTWQKMTYENSNSFWKDEDERKEKYIYKKNENVRCKISYFINSKFKISYTKNYTELKPFLNKVSLKNNLK